MALDKFFRRRRPEAGADNDLPELWTKCPGCKAQCYRRDLEAEAWVCPHCGFHHRMAAEARAELYLDPGSFRRTSGRVLPKDPLNFHDSEPYSARLQRAQKKTGRPDAILCGEGRMEGRGVVLAVLDFAFSGGSMGSVVGEEICRAAAAARESRAPLIIVSASGGARMQESTHSLMQMAKTTVALEALADAGLPYLSVLTDPTTGGVTASFATIADVIVAEPGALIGFAGPRVIQQTIRQNLPEGFQRAEFLLEHGMVDMVLDRRRHKAEIARLLHTLGGAA